AAKRERGLVRLDRRHVAGEREVDARGAAAGVDRDLAVSLPSEARLERPHTLVAEEDARGAEAAGAARTQERPLQEDGSRQLAVERGVGTDGRQTLLELDSRDLRLAVVDPVVGERSTEAERPPAHGCAPGGDLRRPPSPPRVQGRLVIGDAVVA